MSLLGKLFGSRIERFKTLSRPADQRVYVVDATGMVDPRQRNGGQASPRDHFAILRMLAQFAGREGIEIQAVFTGRALREAGDGQIFKGVRVFYAENGAGAQAKMKDLIHKLVAHKDVVLLTADNTLEREAGQLGAVCMRLATLRKSFDERDDRDRNDQGNRGEHGERDRGNRDRGNRRRDDRARDYQNRPNNNSNSPAPETPEASAEEAEPRAKENPTVLDLIDPI